MSLAFDGVRILDFSQVLAGPGATQLLNMLGADVIKIENPASGDQMRWIMQPEGSEKFGMSPGFMSMNFGKRSVALDLKHARAKDVVFKLVRHADVVVENFRAGAIEKLGFGYDAVSKAKPDVIYCSISGYGQQGPVRGAAAYDGAIQAASGMMSVTGHPESGPVRAGYQSADMPTAMTAAFAIASALHRKAKTGEGQYLDVAMLDAAMWLMAPMYSNVLATGYVSGLEGNRSPTMFPTANVFPTADSHIQITAITLKNAHAALRCVGLDELADDPRLAEAQGLFDNHDAIYEKIVEKTKAAESSVWLERLREGGVPCAPVRDIPSVAEDVQLTHREILRTAPAPTGSTDHPSDAVSVVGAPFVAARDGPASPGAPPTIGEHTDKVLSELGFTSVELQELRTSGVFGQ